jgi:hypothetical protein
VYTSIKEAPVLFKTLFFITLDLPMSGDYMLADCDLYSLFQDAAEDIACALDG